MAVRETAGNLRQLRLLDAMRRLIRREATENLERLLVRTRAEDVAAVVPSMSAFERQVLVRALLPEPPRAAEVLAQIGPSVAAPLVTDLERDRAARVLDEMRADDSADLLAALEEEIAHEILRLMHPAEQRDVRELMQYRPTTAGGIMSTDFLAVEESQTAQDTIAALQRSPDAEMVFYVYAVNETGRLVGVLSLRDLLRVPPSTPVGQIMNPDVISVRPDVHQGEVARVVERYDLLAVPVVDEYGRLVGIVTVDDVIDVLREEANEDIMKMAGARAGDDDPESGPTWRSLRARAPWLGISLVGGLLAAVAIAGYRTRIEQIALLAAFVPVVLGIGGSVGTQSAAVVMRGMESSAGDVRGTWRLVLRELRIALPLLGAAGAVVGLAAHGISGHGELGIAVGISLAAVMLVCVVLGAAAPVVLRRFHVDPALASSPAMVTLLHLVSVLIYLAVGGVVVREV
ncbi:magnesium transporter [Myxococcota bacterium]|nr:magnesium transporter [Myxococcota bacterium]